MNLQIRIALDQYLQDMLQSTVFDMNLSIDYTNRSITASYESFDFTEEETAEPTFSKKLFDHISGLDHSPEEVCYIAKVDSRIISRAQASNAYTPSKSIVLALGMALELSETSMENFLHSAGYEFSTTARRDLIIRFFIVRQLYDITEINTYLTHYKELLLGSV